MSEDRRSLLLDADQAARRGDLAAAAVCYRKLLAFTPTDLTLLQRLGDALARSGQDPEARDVLLRLAEEYWRGGFRSRSLAVLRRASRLGGPQPDLLVLLGERTLELGHMADAREPLMEAATLREAAGDIPGAEIIFRQVAESMPRDLVARQALLRLAQRRKAPNSIVDARLEIAMATALNGDLRAAVGCFREALCEHGDGSACLTRLPDLLKIFPLGSAVEFQSRPSGMKPSAEAAWAVTTAAFLAREGMTAEARSVLTPVLDTKTHRSPRISLWAGRVLLDLGEVDTARSLVLSAAEGMIESAQEPATELVDVVTGLVARNPADREAAALLSKLTNTQTPRSTAGTPTQAVAPEPPSGELPQEVKVAITEARSLVQHGLIPQARATLQAIDPEWSRHPEVSRLQREALLAEAKLPRRPAPAPKPKSAPTDEMFVVIEDDEGSVAEVAPSDERAKTPVVFETGPFSVTADTPSTASTPSGTPTSIDQMAVHIQDAIGEEDFETQYQMAIGLFEMGLEDQALEMLERARFAPGRAVEVALLLLQRRTARGEGALAVDGAEAVLDDAAAMSAAVYADFLAALALATHQAGGGERAVRYLRSLEAVFPEHPALESLRGAIVTKF